MGREILPVIKKKKREKEKEEREKILDSFLASDPIKNKHYSISKRPLLTSVVDNTSLPFVQNDQKRHLYEKAILAKKLYSISKQFFMRETVSDLAQVDRMTKVRNFLFIFNWLDSLILKWINFNWIGLLNWFDLI